MAHLSKKVAIKSFQLDLEIHASHTPKKTQLYLFISLIGFLIFLAGLISSNQDFLGTSISAQNPDLTEEGNLITQNDQFQIFEPSRITIKNPEPTPVPSPKPDPRLVILEKYLSQFNSPLKQHAQDFLDAADSYKVDWRLVPAIAGVESTFGRSIPGGHDPKSTSLNAWGWGVYGEKVIKFSSWRQAIFAVTKGLKKDYLDKGLTDPFSINKKYASSPYWAGSLTFFLNDLDSFTSQNQPHALTSPEEFRNKLFEEYAYLKNEETHFSLQFGE